MVAKDTKPKKSALPTYKSMVKNAIIQLKEKKGSSRAGILNKVKSSNPVGTNATVNTRKAIKSMVTSGEIINTSEAKGLNGRFKLPIVEKKKATAVKKPAAKKPAAKKQEKAKTAAPKKKASPKKKAAVKKAVKKAAPKKKAVKKVTKSPAKKQITKAKKVKKAPAKKTSPKKKSAKK